MSSIFLKHNDNRLTKTRYIHEKKLINLGLTNANECNDPDKVIFNYSSRVLTAAEKSLLAKGLNLSIPPKHLKYADSLLPFELLYRDIINSDQEFSDGKEPFEAALRNSAYEFFKNYNAKHEQTLNTDEVTALKSLMQDDSIIIQKSDKGNSVVLLDKPSYVERVNEILADTSKFQKLRIKNGKDYNYVFNQEKRICKVLYDLNKKGVLSDADYVKLSPCGSKPSVLYGLSKVHKKLRTTNLSRDQSCLLSTRQPTNCRSIWVRYLNRIQGTRLPQKTHSRLPMKFAPKTQFSQWRHWMLKRSLLIYPWKRLLTFALS